MATMRNPLQLLADLALPPRCPGCGTVVADDHRFCVACWSALHFIGEPWCAGCNRPFDSAQPAGTRCAECLSNAPIHDGVRAAVAYGPVARHVILRLKYGARTAYADTVARLMLRHLPAGPVLIVPVPLHRWRIWSRGFNQSALIAAALGRLSGMPVALDLIERRRATPVLRGLSGAARWRAVAGAFALKPGRADALHGTTVVLVDDVHTSGATTTACTRVLKQAGAGRVTVLCWARVLRDEPDD